MSAATTETKTQNGIQRPDGEIVWATSLKPKFAGITIDHAANNDRVLVGSRYENGREAMRIALRTTAEEVGINATDFIAAHTYVTREILTITMEPTPGDAASHLVGIDLPF